MWSHLISTTSYAELHAFAQSMRLPHRGFDLDHYDLPESRYHDALALGAIPVSSNELIRLLCACGLRVPARERAAARPQRRRLFLQHQWQHLGTLLAVAQPERWARLGEKVLTAWNEPHRHYHDERHLRDVLLALNQLHVMGQELHPHTLAAAWFHDVIYAGSSTDEAESAAYAQLELEGVGLGQAAVGQVAELILATTPGAPSPVTVQILLLLHILLGIASSSMPISPSLDPARSVTANIQQAYELNMHTYLLKISGKPERRSYAHTSPKSSCITRPSEPPPCLGPGDMVSQFIVLVWVQV